MGLALASVMTCRRCYAPRRCLEQPELDLSAAAAVRYLGRSLRLRSGDSVEFFDAEGGARDARLTEIEPRRIRGAWLAPLRIEPAPLSGPVAVLARLKGRAEEEAIGGLASYGLAEVRIFIAQRDAVSGPMTARQLDRWRQISLDACRQSGGYYGTKIRGFPNLSEALHGLTGLVFGSHDGTDLTSLGLRVGAVIVGPEGGFDPSEHAILAQVGGCSVRLGRRVLRARHAALVLPLTIALMAAEAR
jgi:16S rRNA (uracil1498-N3)-methyltransferase